ncbi:alpha/beta fold hydrolase [Sphingomonas arenae]|uniref:alpha/beta fold hydrolase n=1 Tax=Sphingomonas arenae TaxID=2812555 RepID=UPI0019686B5D|nr:alpha/beta fold hydrolase [Sphingomonas arenae]
MRKWLAGSAALAAGTLGATAYTIFAARKAERSVPMDGHLVQAGKHVFHVAEEGQGRPLLLIHGLAGQMRNFGRAMIEDLARDYRVIRIDRPGSGYSPRLPSGRAHLAEQADAVVALIDELQLEKPVLVGHSLGGALSLAIAIRHPEKVGALALIAPATQRIGSVPEVFKGLVVPPAILPLVAWTVAVPIGVATQKKVLAEVFKPDPVPPNFLIDGGGMLGFRPGAFEGAATDLADASSEAEELVAGYADLKLPVGILYGREDNLLDYRLHGEKTVSEIPGAKLTLTDGGHMLPFTVPEESARFVRSVIE